MSATATVELVTFRVNEQWMGVSVLRVQEVLTAHRVASVPLAPRDIVGLLNLRGQIVTALDLRIRLGLESSALVEGMNVVVRHESELSSLLVDEVGDVISVEASAVEAVPETLHPEWRRVCGGIVRRERDLLVILNIDELLRRDTVAA